MRNRPNREINVLSMSALDLFASALGVFILITIVSFSQADNEGESRLEAVFVVDTTDSMADEVPEIADAIVGTVRSLRRTVPDLSVGVVAYRDRAESFVTRELPLATVESAERERAIVEFLVAAAAAPRGDNFEREEAVGEGLRKAYEMAWTGSGAHPRLVIVVGDAAVHPAEAAATLAQARDFAAAGPGRTVHAVFCRAPDDPHAEFFRDLAAAGRGECVPPLRLAELLFTAGSGAGGDATVATP